MSVAIPRVTADALRGHTFVISGNLYGLYHDGTLIGEGPSDHYYLPYQWMTWIGHLELKKSAPSLDRCMEQGLRVNSLPFSSMAPQQVMIVYRNRDEKVGVAVDYKLKWVGIDLHQFCTALTQHGDCLKDGTVIHTRAPFDALPSRITDLDSTSVGALRRQPVFS
jgi:hypothetical protein